MIWALVIVYSFYIGSFLPIIYIILPTYIGKPIWFAVNVTQHLAAKVDTKDHRLSTYSVRINPILSFLYWHMEYHLEHHMYPMVPSYNLPKLYEEIKDQLPKPQNLIEAYREIIPAVIKKSKDPNYYMAPEINKVKIIIYLHHNAY